MPCIAPRRSCVCRPRSSAAERSLTSRSAAEQKRTLGQTVGSVGFVDAESFTNTYAFTLRDVLKPG